MKNHLKNMLFAVAASIFICTSVMPMSGIFNYFMGKKVEKFTPEDWMKLNPSYIEKKLAGPVAEAAYFVKQAHYSGCFSAFKYVTSEDIIRIILAHNECAVIFLKNCNEQCFKAISNSQQLDSVQKIKKICADAVTSKNLVAVSNNLFSLINQENDVLLARKIISHLNDDNIVIIPKRFLNCLIKTDTLSATTIAQAITPKNIAYFVQDFKDEFKSSNSIIFQLILANYAACSEIIAKNAINEHNFNENIELVDFLLQLETPRFQEIFIKLKAYGPYIQRKMKEYEEREQARKKFEEFIRNNGPNFSSGYYGNPTTMSQSDAYKTLGLQTTASSEQIQKQYRKLARQYHPDLNKDKSESEQKEAEKKMIAINEAYEVLTHRSRL